MRAGENAGCPSHLQLDRLSAGDLTDLERERLERHVAGCAACTHGLAQRAREREQFVPDPRLLAQLGGRAPVAKRRHIAVWAPVILCAAGVVLLVQAARPDPDAVGRHGIAKGSVEPRLLVRSAGGREVVGAVDGATVHPGDQLQVAISLPAPRFVAVYSLDAAGAVTRYAPIEAAMQGMEAGADQLLPNSTILDDVLGRETVAVFACTADQPDATLRAHVQRGAPPGCEVVRVDLVKVAP